MYELGHNLEAATLSAIREAGMIIVPASPTSSMIKAAYKIAPSLSAEQFESIYFLMTNAWLRPVRAEAKS